MDAEGFARGWQRVLLERDRLPEGVRDCYLVAEDDRGTMIAVACGSVNRADRSRVLGEVHALYVDPNRHGRGVGRLLLQQLSKCLADRGATTVQIGVLMSNQDARGFMRHSVVNSSANGSSMKTAISCLKASTSGPTSLVCCPLTERDLHSHRWLGVGGAHRTDPNPQPDRVSATRSLTASPDLPMS